MQTVPPTPDSTETLRLALAEALPDLGILTGEADRAFYSSDVYSAGATAELVIAPSSVESLQAAVEICTAHGFAVIGRGGGLSYTAGYLPVSSRSVIVDLSRLRRIVEINVEDMYVTVESGCTWRELYAALKDKGLRTPYFGPMSGYLSTVGGAMSQGSVFLGSTAYGSSAESVLSLDVVLADGTLLATGSAAGSVRASPFFRAHGPDLTGLFLNDAGALGLKARVTLALVPFPPQARFASFRYDSAEDMLQAIADVSRSGLAAECFGTDPYVQSRRIHEQNLGKDFAYLKAVATSGASLLAGVGAAARMAWKGRRSLGGEHYVMNVTLDAATPEAADANFALIMQIAARRGTEIEATVPRAIRSLPFTYPNDILGDRGERWVPTHALAPHSRALEVVRALEQLFADREQILAEHQIEWGYIVFAVSTRTTLIEPLFYWPDARTPYHERMIEPAHLAKLPVLEPNPAATAAVRVLRDDLVRLFTESGCASLQIGKTYRYLETRQPAAAELLRSIKDAVDPRYLVNPGALGLE
jgi:FAD/FMN-containing dehydrogenase